MTAQNENGFDFFNTGANVDQIHAILGDMGYYYPNGTAHFYMASTPIVTGRYGYGKRLAFGFGSDNSPDYVAIRPIGKNSAVHCADGYTAYGIHIEPYTQPGSAPAMVIWDLVANACVATVSFEPNGVVAVWRGLFTTLLGESEAGQWRLNVDFDAEVHWQINSTTSISVEVRIHTIGAGSAAGATPAIHLINHTVATLPHAYFDGYGFGYHPGSFGVPPYFEIDDERCWDNQGSINNAFLGTQRVQTLLPGGNGAHQDYTSSNGGIANYLNASNNLVDDSLYRYDGSIGDYDLYTPQPLVNSGAPISWISANCFARQDDATQHFIKNRVVSAGSTFDGFSFATPSTYALDSDILETDPATSIQFTGSAVNALSFGTLFYA
jgi:hypothetical protein